MVALVAKLHAAGARIVARTDGYGLELVREIELHQQSGLTNAEALQTATVILVWMAGMVDRVGSIAVGKTADIMLLDGDVPPLFRAKGPIESARARTELMGAAGHRCKR